MMKTMKHRMISMVAGLLLASLLPLAANAHEWQTTSTLKTGSEYNSKVTFVGAEKVDYIPMRSTSTMLPASDVPTPSTESSEPAMRKTRRGFDVGGESGQSEEFPIGEPWVLLLFAAAAAAVIAVRNRRHAFGKKD